MKIPLAALLCATLLGGCTTSSDSVKQNPSTALGATASAPLAPSADSFVIDHRDPSSKRSHSLGNFMYDCNFGVWNFGDVGGASDRIPRLERDLTAAFGAQAAQPLILRKYSVFQNRAQSIFEKTGSHHGLVGAVMTATAEGPGAGLEPKCPREKMSGGWFDPADLTNSLTPITVDMDLTYRGRDYVVTAAYSSPGELPFSHGRNADSAEWIATVQAAMAKANARLIDAIKAAEAH